MNQQTLKQIVSCFSRNNKNSTIYELPTRNTIFLLFLSVSRINSKNIQVKQEFLKNAKFIYLHKIYIVFPQFAVDGKHLRWLMLRLLPQFSSLRFISEWFFNFIGVWHFDTSIRGLPIYGGHAHQNNCWYEWFRAKWMIVHRKPLSLLDQFGFD